MRPLLPVFLLATLLPAPRAQDVLAELVPADAQFACYVDLQAAIDFIGRDLIQAAVTEHVDLGGIDLRPDWNERLRQEWGIDPLRDLHGLLLFGDAGEREQPHVVLLTSAGIDLALQKLREAGVLEAEREDGVEIDRIVPGQFLASLGVDAPAEADGKAFVHVRRLRGDGPARAVLFGTDPRRLVPAARALGSGGRGGKRVLELAARPGCIAYLEVGDTQRMLRQSPASRMASKTKQFVLQLTESRGQIELTATLEAETAKDARQLAALVNGLKALVGLVEPDEDVPEAVLEALNDAHADADGTRVSLRFELPSAVLDEARRSVRAQMRGGDRDADEPAPGARRRRTIR
jgi:hypothetical protein